LRACSSPANPECRPQGSPVFSSYSCPPRGPKEPAVDRVCFVSKIATSTSFCLCAASVVGQDGILRGDWRSPLFESLHRPRKADCQSACFRPSLRGRVPPAGTLLARLPHFHHLGWPAAGHDCLACHQAFNSILAGYPAKEHSCAHPRKHGVQPKVGQTVSSASPACGRLRPRTQMRPQAIPAFSFLFLPALREKEHSCVQRSHSCERVVLLPQRNDLRGQYPIPSEKLFSPGLPNARSAWLAVSPAQGLPVTTRRDS
jgi:hypothetical protein